MKKFLFFLFFTQSIFCFDFKFTDIIGNTNYKFNDQQTLSTNMEIGYRLDLYQPKHKKWSLFLNGILNPDYDHFGNEFKINTFTTLGFDF